jgi:hypothetical protein
MEKKEFEITVKKLREEEERELKKMKNIMKTIKEKEKNNEVKKMED